MSRRKVSLVEIAAIVILCALMTGCGAVGRMARAGCDFVAAIPDETLAVGAAVGGMVVGPAGGMAAEYAAASRPISGACADWDAAVDLMEDSDNRPDKDNDEAAAYGRGVVDS